MNKVVYTAIFGDKDELQTIAKSANCDYVLFTDNPKLRSNDFEIVLCPTRYQDPTRNARFYKILSHVIFPEYEYSLWIDGSIAINTISIENLFDQYLENHDIAQHSHFARQCIYDEAVVCCRLNKDDPLVIRKQMLNYRTQGYPAGNGLTETTIIFRRHTPEIAKLNEDWWQEIASYSRRDQLSFNYAAWKNNIDYFIIDGAAGLNKMNGFKIVPHQKREDFQNWRRPAGQSPYYDYSIRDLVYLNIKYILRLFTPITPIFIINTCQRFRAKFYKI